MAIAYIYQAVDFLEEVTVHGNLNTQIRDLLFPNHALLLNLAAFGIDEGPFVNICYKASALETLNSG